MHQGQQPFVRRAAGLTPLLVVVLAVTGCSGSSRGAPGAAVATGDAESQRAADRVVRDYADDIGYDLPPPGSPTARIDGRVPAVLDAWRATVTRELVSATGRSSDRRLLVKLTVDWEPSNTSDWGGEPSPARVARCFAVTPNPENPDGPGGIVPDWRAVEAGCEA